jgi:peptide/nickel transport system substrate-binding protein
MTTRRGFTGLMAGFAAAAGLPRFARAQSVDGREPPSLAARVAKGELPPLAQRIGTQPDVITPLERTGAHGGRLRFALRGSSDHNHILRMVGPQGLVRWDPRYTKIVPNVARSFDVSDDARVFTFHLREGMRWSDGTPFTADDVMFNMEDVVLAAALGPVPPRYKAGDKPVKVEKLDTYTVRFSFVEGYGDFLAELATPLVQHPTLYAKHYCSQFLPKYNAKANEVAKAAGAADWQNYFLLRCGDIEIPSRWSNPERPTLDPWLIREPYVGGATRILLVRNPYFWQVDTAGNQLPYVDELFAPISQDVQSLVLEAIAGRIDFQIRHLDTSQNRPVLAQNREKGGYRFVQAAATGGSNMVIHLNMTHKDPEWRRLFGTRDFRVALSQAMDRKTIIDTALLGEGEPWQQGPFEDHPNFNKRLSTQFLDYKPEEANRLLDAIGLKKGPDGIRLLPSGRPLRFKVDVIPTLNPEHVDILQLVSQQWKKVGVAMDVNALERTFFYQRTSEANDHDAAVWTAVGSWAPGEVPQQIVPVHHDSRWAIPWVQWYKSGGTQGEEPPPSTRERMRLYDKVRATVDPEARRALLKQMSDIAAEEFEVIGISKMLPTYGIASIDLVNAPQALPASWFYPTPAPTLPQSWFWKSPQRRTAGR